VARFLSAEWFAQLERGAGDVQAGPPLGGQAHEPPPGLVVEIVVADGPEGELRYELMVEGGMAKVRAGGTTRRQPQVRLVSDYATISGIASGRLCAPDALAAGRAKLSGDTAALFALAGELAGLDLLPSALRAATTF
jgi:hypothetical protein